jgi:uncharacterized protein
MAEDTKTLSMLVHIAALFTSFVGPLIFMLVSKDAHVQKHSKIALNWQISLMIYMVVSGVLAIILVGFLMMAVLGLMNLIFCIMAAVKANQGVEWKYPLSIAFFK